ncbi:dipeptide ABC transporter ATP-binding protein [Gordonia sp. CPCC 205333]|uniref:dipeptide ABC transporter ATP-binding protein n=1 Tax=Gordonia sp. CPCC 205333 TaxID=3140790 RepID=UPI003AF3E634
MTEQLATIAPAAANSAAPLLAVDDLVVEFGSREPHRAVDGVTFEIARGETFAVVGESGSGKSITAAAILGLLPDSARIANGSVALDGRDLLPLRGADARSYRGSQIGMIFQNPLASLDPSFKIGSQLREIIGLHRPATRRRHQQQIAQTWLQNVGITDTERVLGAYPHELSGGMRQRVMIAIASLSQPTLLIADEPTTALDAVTQKQILDLLKSVIDENGSSLLLITHDFGVVSYLADRVAVMRTGRIVETSTRSEVLSRPSHDYTRALIAAVPELGSRAKLSAGHRRHRLGSVDQRPGEPAGPNRNTSAEATSIEVMVEVSRVTKEYVVGGLGTGQPRTHITAVDDVSLRIDVGQSFGLIGESGSGKSTLARLIGGLQPVTAGHVVVAGNDIGALPPRRVKELRPRFQFVFQDATSSLNPRIPVGEQISRPLRRFGRATSRKSAAAQVKTVFDLVSLPDSYVNRYPHELSGGQRQRIGIARAIALRPDLLILDEPTSALDVSTQAQILNLLLDLKDELGLTYVFIGHNLAIIEYFCDRIGVLQAGRLIETFGVDQLFAADRHAITRGLLDAVLPLDAHAG